MKKKKKIIATVVILAVFMMIAGVGIFFIHSISGEKKDGETVQQSENMEESAEEPANKTIDTDNIQGFTKAPRTEDTEESPVTLTDPGLQVEAVGQYSGSFLEDGSDDPIVNVASLLITNTSDRMLQIAEITFQVNDSETAQFKVTDLPAGCSALVLETGKREFKEEDQYTVGDTATAYIDTPSLLEDKFEIQEEDGKIILKNKTDEVYGKVYVYYKYVRPDGIYMGGITYRTPFENVPAQGEAEAVAVHFIKDASRIMDVQIVSE